MTNSQQDAPKSVCVLRLSALGDVCNAVAAVQAVQRAYPASHITWIIGKLEHQLVHDLPGIEFIVFDKRRGSTAIKDLKQTLSGRRFDVLLQMQVAMRANRLAHLIPAKRKIGYDFKRAKEGHSLVVNERIPRLNPKDARQHVLDSFLSFAMTLGASEEDCYPPRWNIPLSDEDKQFADNYILPSQPTAIICPAASKRERCWLPDRYTEVIHSLESKGIKTILCGGPSELDYELARNIMALTRVDVIDLVGKTSLKQLYALLSKALFVLAPDTGPLHMANAAGRPCVGLYAHSNPARTGPYNSLEFVAEQYHEQLMLQQGKAADQLKWGLRVKGIDLMADISTLMVLQKIDALLCAKG